MKKSKKKRAPTRLELAYHPELYRFVSPVFVLDEISAAMMVGLSAADRLAYYGFPRAVSRIMEHQYIHPDEVQEIYRHNVGRPVPPLFQAYADALAAKKVKLARGRSRPPIWTSAGKSLLNTSFVAFSIGLPSARRFRNGPMPNAWRPGWSH